MSMNKKNTVAIPAALALWLSFSSTLHAEPLNTFCKMGSCLWEEILSEEVILEGDLETGYLLLKRSVQFTTNHQGDYPDYFDPSFERIGEDLYQTFIYCSASNPAVFWKKDEQIYTLNVISPLGDNEIIAVNEYLYTCHRLAPYSHSYNQSKLLSLGYKENGGQTFATADQLIEITRNEPQTEYRKVGHFFKVFGVASNDVLNVRALPDSDSPILSVFQPNTPLLDVFSESEDGKWFEVNAGEGTGWIRNKFVEELKVSVFPGSSVPNQLTCFSSEPFINAQFDRTVASFTGLDQHTKISLSPVQVLSSSPAKVMMVGTETGEQIFISNHICGDDAGRKFPYTMTSSNHGGGANFCCTLK